MRLLKTRKLPHRLWNLFRRDRLEGELAAELQFHLQEQIKKNIAAGMTPEEARYAALRAFGSVDRGRGRTCRDVWSARLLEEFCQDIKYGSRMLFKNPGFTAVAVLTLGLGIGVNTSIFSVVNAMLLRPLRLSDPDRLVVISEVELRHGGRRSATMGCYQEWKRHNRSFEGIARASLGGDPATLSGIGHAERIELDYASPNFFSLLGVNAFRGRTFLPEDAPGGEGNAIVISHDLWQRTFTSSEDVIGQTVSIDGNKKTIVGVIPSDFSVFPWKMTVDVWLAFNFDRLEPNMRWMDVVGRLKPGISFQQAQSELAAIASHLPPAQTSEGEAWNLKIETLHEANAGNSRGFFYLLLGAVGFVLLVACANVANLSLARATARRKEMAIRASMGASRRRLLLQVLTESTLLALFGGGLGILLAIWGQRIVVTLAPVGLLSSLPLRIDERALAFTFAISVFTGLLFGIIPALQASKPDLNEFLKEAGARSGGGSRDRGRATLLGLGSRTLPDLAG